MTSTDSIRVVLVEPEHPGNIGAAARAMANMGLSRLSLVAPHDFPSQVATARASGAGAILESAQVSATLDEAIADCSFAVASTARARTVAWPVEPPETAMRELLAHSATEQVALIFGSESNGLTNDELDRCQLGTRIPVAESFSSMNLGSAVSVMLYELRRQAHRGVDPARAPNAQAPCSAADARHLLDHASRVLRMADPKRAGFATRMRVITRVLNRASMLASEVHMFRGILSAVEEKMMRSGDVVHHSHHSLQTSLASENDE